MAEVASPGQTATELEAKARAWLASGVRLVWLIWPRRREVKVWRLDAAGGSAAGARLAATLAIGDTLDGLDVLPGFRFPVADLFA